MKFDARALYEAQRASFDLLKNLPADNVYKVKPNNVTMDARIQQELVWQNTQNVYIFNFGTNAPAPATVGGIQLNNVILGENNILCMYGISIYFGQNASATNRIYRSYNITVNDGALYNGEMSMKLESNTPIEKMDMMGFRDEGDFIQSAGLSLINPFRVFTGRVATVQVIIQLPVVAGFALTPDMVISCRLHGALGLA